MTTNAPTPSAAALISAVRSNQVAIQPCTALCPCGSKKIVVVIGTGQGVVTKRVCPACGS